jgi:hypothetical protein
VRAVAVRRARRANGDTRPYAGRRGHISSRLAAGESVPAVAENRGTSRKTITAHYHEDLGDDFERPYPPFEQQLSRERVGAARIWVPRAPATETLRCEASDHDWERVKRPGAKPRSCPEHRSKRAHYADVIERASLPARAAPPRGASTPSDGGARGRRERRGATLPDAATSPSAAQIRHTAVAKRPNERRNACKMPS